MLLAAILWRFKYALDRQCSVDLQLVTTAVRRRIDTLCRARIFRLLRRADSCSSELPRNRTAVALILDGAQGRGRCTAGLQLIRCYYRKAKRALMVVARLKQSASFQRLTAARNQYPVYRQRCTHAHTEARWYRLAVFTTADHR